MAAPKKDKRLVCHSYGMMRHGFFHQLFISPHTVSHARISPAAPLGWTSRQRHNASFARHLIMRISVPLAHAYRLLNHGPLTLISSAHADQRNIMAAAWAMPVDFQPPKVAVVIDKSSHTRQLIEASGHFVLALPGQQLARTVLQLGSHSGRDIDKFAAFGLHGASAEHGGGLLLDGCAAWLECKILPEPAMAERHDMFLAEVLAAWADDQAWCDGRWTFADPALRTLHYVAGGQFFVTGDSLVIEQS